MFPDDVRAIHPALHSSLVTLPSVTGVVRSPPNMKKFMCYKCLGSFTALEDLKEHWLTHPELRAALPRTQQVILKENTQDLTEDFEPDINDPLVGQEMHEETKNIGFAPDTVHVAGDTELKPPLFQSLDSVVKEESVDDIETKSDIRRIPDKH